ncbi:MAG: hypothetical protein OEN56_00210 [Gemmatimonadota bacterium]|nr:hypothetical protein [Gemmatimonadota bacterium]
MSRPPSAVVLALAALLVHGTAEAQSAAGNSLETAAGAALGFYSGSMLGLVGTMMPCNRTLSGGRCTISGAGTGGALGIAMGGLIGGQNPDGIWSRAENAGIGALAGAVVGVGLRSAVRQYGWADVGATAALGGAVGAAPRGSLIGAGAGVVTGALVWWIFPKAGLPDFILLTLAGTAVGGMVDWADGAATAQRDRAAIRQVFSISVR